MSSNSSDNTSWRDERTGLPKYLSTPGAGSRGWKEPSASSQTNSKYDPAHYHGSVEPWDLIAAQNLGFFEGNIIKYVVRAGRKDGESVLDDLIKAQVYLKKLIEIRSHQ